MKIKCSFIKSHEPIFIGGVNYGDKLQEKNSKGALILVYDIVQQLGYVQDTKTGKLGCIPNVAYFEPINPTELGFPVIGKPQEPIPRHISHPQVMGTSVKAQIGGPQDVFKPVSFTAQVSTPQDKVQGKPGKKAKFQGEESQGE